MTKKALVPIVLPADPAAAMEAATKQYVDGHLLPSEVVAGTGITVTPSGGNITIAATGTTLTAGAGLSLTGSTLDVAAADGSIVVAADSIRAGYAGTGSAVTLARSDHTHTPDRVQQSGQYRTGDSSSATSPVSIQHDFGSPLARDGFVTVHCGLMTGFASAQMNNVSADLYTNQRSTPHSGGARYTWFYIPTAVQTIAAATWAQIGMATLSWYLPAGNTPQFFSRVYWTAGGAGAYTTADVTWVVFDV